MKTQNDKKILSSDSSNTPLYQFVVKHSGETLEHFLLEEVELGPRQALKHAFIHKMIFVNSKPARRQYILQSGDVVKVKSANVFLKKDLMVHSNPKLSLKILLETTEMVVVDKPAGQNVHPLKPDETGSTLNALVAKFPEIGCIFNEKKPLEGGLVHRLDRGTSGILVCARTKDAWQKLKSLWKKGAIKKVYVAWVTGQFTKDETCRLFLFHDPKSKKKMAVSVEKPHGINSWETMTSFLPLKTSHDKTLVLIRLHTGVMHQIRAVSAALGHPILGDKIYAKSIILPGIRFSKLGDETLHIFKKLQDCIPSFSELEIKNLPKDGFFLHALWLSLDHQTEIMAKPPEYF